MIRSRSLDLFGPNSNKPVYTNQLLKRIQISWHQQNSAFIDITRFEVKLADLQIYTSKFQPVIQRVYYFLTINNKDVNDDKFTEPTLVNFNQNIMPIANVSFNMARKAFRVYLNGDADSTNIHAIRDILSNQWIDANPQCKYTNGSIKHV